jgi:hypothetical protein
MILSNSAGTLDDQTLQMPLSEASLQYPQSCGVSRKPGGLNEVLKHFMEDPAALCIVSDRL